MKLFIFALIIACSQAFSLHEIAFFKVYKANGDLVQLEVDGEYSHIALKVNDNWLHSHPLRGVEFINNLKEAGFDDFEVDIFKLNMSIDKDRVDQYINKPYDRLYSWSDEAFYCSELIAKILSIPPTAMNFDSKIWKGDYQNQRGEIGISPDEVFSYLTLKESGLF